MTVTLRSLKLIENYKSVNPHYADLLDIWADILVLREEYRKNMSESIFDVQESLFAQKMEGGLPLVDIAGKEYDLSRPKKYFQSLIAIAEKKNAAGGKEITDFINSDEFNWEKMIKSSFDRVDSDANEEAATEVVSSAVKDQDNFDLIDLFAERKSVAELEKVAEKYGVAVEKAGWSEGYCPICGKEPKIGEIRW